jgi:hypothetical protein
VDNDVDFAEIVEEHILDESQQPDDPRWLPSLRRSINGLHHSQAALHRKVDHMSKIGDELVASVEALGEKETALEGVVSTVADAVKGGAQAFVDLETHIDELVAGGTLTEEQATALKSRTDGVGTNLDKAAQALTAAATTLSGDAATGEAAAGAGAGTGTGGGGGTATPDYYNFTGDPANIDTTAYTKAPVQGTGGVALYTFNADVAGEAPKGAPEGSGWAVWTQATEPIPAA